MGWPGRPTGWAVALLGAIFLPASHAMAQGQKQSRPFIDCAECPEMVPIPPGNFIMGVPLDEEERVNVPRKFRGRSAPEHEVTIRESFAVGKYMVTRAEFAAFVLDSAYPASDRCWIYDRNPVTQSPEWQERIGYNWRHPGYSQTDRDPVVCVGWDDAKAYVEWLSKKTRRPYRLPTEAEWEYAARAGSSTAWFWGDDPSQACRYADVSDITKFTVAKRQPDGVRNSNCAQPLVTTSPVGSYKPNDFGLYDMLGNA